MVVDANPAPVVVDANPAPVVVDANPAPVVEDANPAPVVEDANPAPVVEDANPAPVVEDANPGAASGGQSFVDWLIGLFGVDQKTIDLANNFIKGGNAITLYEAGTGSTLRGKVQKNAAGAWYSASVVSGKHQCSCRDAADNQKPMPCKHVLALAIMADNGLGITGQSQPPSRQPPSRPAAQPPAAQPPAAQPPSGAVSGTGFQQRVSKRIAGAIMKTAKRLLDMIADGLVPIMLGPTGTGKSSSARYLAQLLSAGYEEVCLNSSFTEADLYGIQVNATTRIEGVIARAFRRARAGEVMVVNIDEFYRANRRIQDLFMGLLLPVDPATARSRGIETSEPVFIGESAVWGVEWAPCSKIKWIMGANPWGQVIDPAFARRVQPIAVTFDPDVLAPFATTFAEKIKGIWELVDQNILPLPIEYGQLSRARNDHDECIFPSYLDKLAMIDNSPQKTLMSIARGVLCPVIAQ